MAVLSLENSVALVTGASGGIGSALCHALAEAGATVVATDLAQTPSEQRPPGDWIDLDVTSADDWARPVGEIRTRHGRLDILVNNAGIDIVERFEDLTLDSWRRTQAQSATDQLRNPSETSLGTADWSTAWDCWKERRL